MENYELGDMNNDLFLKMTVGTPGTAYSVVTYFQNGMSKPMISESDIHSGNIQEINFGKVTDNKNKLLHFNADIDLSHLNAQQCQLAVKTLAIQIEIRGGLNGTKIFYNKPEEVVVTPDGKTLIFNKMISLI